MRGASVAGRAGGIAMAALLLCLCAPSQAAEPDWMELAAPDVVRVVTVDPDGDVRVTKVWIVAHAGSAWLRTSDSRWLANLRRDPSLELRSGDETVTRELQRGYLLHDRLVRPAMVEVAMPAPAGAADEAGPAAAGEEA